MTMIKAALDNLEIKATTDNCRNLNTCHFIVDKVLAVCDEMEGKVEENDDGSNQTNDCRC